MHDDATLKETIRAHYAQVATGQSCCGDDCGCDGARLEDLGYSSEELGKLPAGARRSAAGCGNPTALADLQAGQTVLDLGSGAGIDVFLAAERVGPTGRALGVDMTPAMVERARANAAERGFTNVEFHLGEVAALPLAGGSVDVVLSNCVLNLAPDKGAAFSEAFRVLKPGGRLAVSDLVAVGALPPEVRADAARWAGCVAGALDRDDYLQKIADAGFANVRVVQESEPLGEYPIVSVTVRADKPAA